MIIRVRIPSLARAALLGAAAVLVAGCGSSGFVINPAIVQNAIEVGIAQQQHVLTVVTCPSGVTAHKGGQFKCTVTFGNGGQTPVTVTMLDNQGNVRYAGLQGYVNGHPRR